MDIEFVIKRHRITNLFHFTRVENLGSILQYGILSRAEVAAAGIPASINDTNRYDRQIGAISLSISFPAYRMFYSYRRADLTGIWCVLAASTDVLRELPCRYYPHNAATKLMQSVDPELCEGPKALSDLFDDPLWPGNLPRALDLKPHHPTHPDHEVLVTAPIRPDLLQGIFFNQDSDMWPIRRNIPFQWKYLCRSNPKYFQPRSDWQHIKKMHDQGRL